MKIFAVYHSKDISYRYLSKKKFPKTPFTYIATVKCNDLDEVFEQTNHIDNNWTNNKLVLHFS